MGAAIHQQQIVPSTAIPASLKEALVDQFVLVFDGYPSNQSVFKHFFIDNGCSSERVCVTNSFFDAVEFIEKNHPKFIISDYRVSEHFAFELSEIHKRVCPENLDRIFLVASEHSLHASAGDLRTEGFDGFILKPFSEVILTRHLELAIENKYTPSTYCQHIDAATCALQKNDIAAAVDHLQQAAESLGDTAEISFFKGVIAERQKQSQNAITFYDHALEQAPYFFKAHLRKLNILVHEKRYDDAFAMLEFIRANFPLSEEIIQCGIISAVMTNRFNAVDEYFDYYQRLRHKSEDLRRFVSAAFLTAGKILLKSKRHAESLSCFKKGNLIAINQLEYVEEVLKSFLSAGLPAAYHDYFAQFTTQELPAPIVRCAKFRIAEWDNQNIDVLIGEARHLIFSKEADPHICLSGIRLVRQKGNSILLETLLAKSCECFPERTREFKAAAFDS